MMTTAEALEMPRRELDAMVAEAMGEPKPTWSPWDGGGKFSDVWAWSPDPAGDWIALPFSTEIAPAMRLVTWLQAERYSTTVTFYWGGEAWANVMHNVETIGNCHAETAPLAIVLAFLKARGVVE